MIYLFDRTIATAVSRIKLRSDDEAEEERLKKSFVDTGILISLENDNDQIIFGRRGTGKTHMLRFLAARAQTPEMCTIFLDARNLGSSQQFSNHTIQIEERCIALFRDVLWGVTNALEAHLLRYPPSNYLPATEALTDLNSLLGDPYEERVLMRVEEKKLESTSKSNKAGVKLGIKEVGADLSHERKTEGSEETASSYSVRQSAKIVFPNLANALDEVLKIGGFKVVIYLDEWSSLPEDLQPYLAEFLRRTMLPLNSVTLKIAALEYRSRFHKDHQPGPGRMGFEIGADITTARNLDDYYTIEMNQDGLMLAFANVLYSHLFAELKSELTEKYKIYNAPQLLDALAAGPEVFKELVLASEGNLRDFIQIFCHAYSSDYARRSRSLSLAAVRASARQHSTLQKLVMVPEKLRPVLTHMMKKCVENLQSRWFLLTSQMDRDASIQALLDARVLHVAERSFTSIQHVGTYYTRYALDYGLVLPYVEKGVQIAEFSTGREPNAHDCSIEEYLEMQRNGGAGI